MTVALTMEKSCRPARDSAVQLVPATTAAAVLPGVGSLMQRMHCKAIRDGSREKARPARASPSWVAPRLWRAKHGDVLVCATTACLRARLRTAPIRSRERQRADAQLLMPFCLAHAPQRHAAPLGAGHAKKCGWKPAPDYRHAATRVPGMRGPGGGIPARR